MTYLKYVVEVARVQSITRAAQNLYMGQPNLSKAIKELEKETGITIFRRTSKGVVPTPKGEEFLGYARSILAQLNELESLYKPRDNGALEISAAVPRSAEAAGIFAGFLNSRADQEHIDVHFRETGALTAVTLAAGGEADFAIIRYPNTYSGYFERLLEQNALKSEVLREFQLQLMLSASHPLAGLPEIQYHMLAGYIEIVHGDYQAPSLAFSQIKRGAGMDAPLRRITVYDRASQYDMLNLVPGSFLWSAPVPKRILEQNRLVMRPCALSDIANLDVLVYPSDRDRPKATEELMEAFRQAGKKPERIPGFAQSAD